jgi:hypothetical protein
VPAPDATGDDLPAAGHLRDRSYADAVTDLDGGFAVDPDDSDDSDDDADGVDL